MKRQQMVTVSVIGGSVIDEKVEQLAHDAGRVIGEVGAVLVCGGLGGAMEASSRGAKEAGGLTIGLLPGKDKADANDFIDIALPLTIGFARNACVAASADVIVALPGSHGTSSEISYGLVYKRPIIDLGGWGRDGMLPCAGPHDLKAMLQELIANLKEE